jgi:hypothetical protein
VVIGDDEEVMAEKPRIAWPRARLLAAGLVVVIAGCNATGLRTPTQPPPVLGIDWGRAASVERPGNYEQSVPPNYPGTHPILRISGQAYMVDVVGVALGGFAAVGYVPPDWTPASWTSPDGQTWAFHPMGTTAFTFPVAMTVGAQGQLVAVGRSGTKPLAWTSGDGVSWQEHRVATLGDDSVAERMTTVVAGDGLYVAGGSVGPELAERHARFWTSPDGAVWTPVRDDDAAFADAEVRSITRFHDGFVAVGVVGTAQRATAAVAWTSPDGEAWTRVDDPSFAGDVAVSVISAPAGGLVAVGNDADRREAISWTSTDGRAWTKAPTEPSRQHPGGFIWMTDVASIGDELIAVGDFQGLQRGTATSWVSKDGLAWRRANTAPVQEQGELYAIAAGGPGAIAVGSYGAPDSYIPEVWLTPDRD